MSRSEPFQLAINVSAILQSMDSRIDQVCTAELARLLSAPNQIAQSVAVPDHDDAACRVDDPGGTPKAELMVHCFATSPDHTSEIVLGHREDNIAPRRRTMVLRENQEPFCQSRRKVKESRVLDNRAGPPEPLLAPSPPVDEVGAPQASAIAMPGT